MSDENRHHRYRYVRCATGTIQWCKLCGHVPLKNPISRKISEKGCWSWRNKNYKIERPQDDSD